MTLDILCQLIAGMGECSDELGFGVAKSLRILGARTGLAQVVDIDT